MRMQARPRLMAMLLTLACSVATAAYADDRLETILKQGVLRVGTPGDYAPFALKHPVTEQYQGMDADAARQMARALGVRLEWVPTSWPTLMDDLKADRFDLALGGISVSLERQKTGLFSAPYLTDGKTPIARCADKAKYQTLKQIGQPGVRVIENAGGTNERFARAHLPAASIQIHPDNVTIWDELVARRADVMITDAVEARLQQKLHPTLCAIHPDTPFDFAEKAFLLPNDWRWKSWVDQWLHVAAATGSLGRLEQHWLDWPWDGQAPGDDLEALVALMGERLKLMPDVARYKWNNHLPIEDLPREKAILDELVVQATQAGVPEVYARTFFAAQMDAAKKVQQALFDQWREADAGEMPDVPDLKNDIRPALDAMTPRLLELLGRNLSVLRDHANPSHLAEALDRYLSKDRWGDAAQIAARPLRD